MKSAHKPTTRREALTKYVRAKAHKEGTLFLDALEAVKATENGRGSYIPNMRSRPYHEPRPVAQRLRKERDAKIPHREQPCPTTAFDNIDDASSEADAAPRHTDMTVPILKIARAAKRKGLAKEFEIVRSVRNVIALPEESKEPLLVNDDDWEKIYDEEEVDARRSYSSVLRGNET